jgi:hypothetical protein
LSQDFEIRKVLSTRSKIGCNLQVLVPPEICAKGNLILCFSASARAVVSPLFTFKPRCPKVGLGDIQMRFSGISPGIDDAIVYVQRIRGGGQLG